MKTPRKTDPIDDLINELLRPIKLLRELKKAKQEIARLTQVLEEEEESFIKINEMEDIIINLYRKNGQLEEKIKTYEEKLNATS